jgi:hypothetical protein
MWSRVLKISWLLRGPLNSLWKIQTAVICFIDLILSSSYLLFIPFSLTVRFYPFLFIYFTHDLLDYGYPIGCLTVPTVVTRCLLSLEWRGFLPYCTISFNSAQIIFFIKKIQINREKIKSGVKSHVQASP